MGSQLIVGDIRPQSCLNAISYLRRRGLLERCQDGWLLEIGRRSIHQRPRAIARGDLYQNDRVV
ncbi:hypothetical protein PEL8287_02374 [Roseovarius litorisediminis]|uniref:Uncharacterized protein n=1 Tax=Roseovarius litorisediminis TaxID=1312363 RepID=A0A1Y5ST44_9RHOB|nr:hypothetical protein PEL8287_02374 [Roseovarius litorisediminis]